MRNYEQELYIYIQKNLDSFLILWADQPIKDAFCQVRALKTIAFPAHRQAAALPSTRLLFARLLPARQPGGRQLGAECGRAAVVQ